MARKSRTAQKRGPSANVIATVAVVVLAVAVIGGVLLFNRSDDDNGGGGGGGTGSGSIPAELRTEPDSNTLTEASDGTVTVVEFLDYQCPACAAYYANVTKKLETDYAEEITFVTRDFPLAMHPLARQAAQAARAAAAQGKYREMYHQLYDNYEQWAVAPGGQELSDDAQQAATFFDSYATEIGLDLDRFHTDMTSAATGRRIDADVAAGEKVGVSSTPTIFVNGAKLEPEGETYGDVDRQLRGMIDEALGR
ncbi:DsbA family protein [Actinophytocola algeriensis]|uniref:Protein-disulfide isomerase n=1 Tax=Actinophytocola algeriensis TaxID=1768010 RepID=A0A7W7VDE7_9PSEU|nr:thioredoxin domain-containing protein [Actinophytocola algeriensis]MBB4906014.1 protein-disulfide isomerase [Actinophytocola algeriensis]MBE1472301.1 protein-disulfide isomerase [Actinophytocola algeriensis]